jgi:hypothetical protein
VQIRTEDVGMKIIEVNQEQFKRLWELMFPAQRSMVEGLMCPAINMRALGVQAVIVVKGDVELTEFPKDVEMRLFDMVVFAKGESAAGAASGQGVGSEEFGNGKGPAC